MVDQGPKKKSSMPLSEGKKYFSNGQVIEHMPSMKHK